VPQVVVKGVPAWVPHLRLLGPGDWTETDEGWTAALSREAAADLSARLRNLGMDGAPFDVRVTPALKRKVVRDARSVDARRRRDTSPGFTRPDARLDDEGRWSLTPEKLAFALGQRAPTTVVDATCGAGGNAIGFARAGTRVVAIEKDRHRAELARHNARVYGVADKVDVRVGDAAELLADIDAELCFVDPPWEGYDAVRCELQHLTVLSHILPATERFEQVWLKLPPSFVTADLPGFMPRAWFGHAKGDKRRVKFLLLARPDQPASPRRS